jgi:hypothetical protein
MATQWLRLWHELPTDPKFKVVSKISKQPISLVLATYIFLLVDASQSVKRGVTQCDAETISSALDCEIDQIEKILEAMQTRLIDGNLIKNWDKRQVVREDDYSYERVKNHRVKLKSMDKSFDMKRKETQRNAMKRNETLDTDTDTQTDQDTNTDLSVSSFFIKKKKEKIDRPKPVDNFFYEKCPYENIRIMYNQICNTLPECLMITGDRKYALDFLWQKYELKTLQAFEDCFREAAQSKFLTGQIADKNGQVFYANFDWLITDKYFLKTHDGKYRNKKIKK